MKSDRISVIIPIRRGDQIEAELHDISSQHFNDIIIIKGKPRAQAMNEGAAQASGRYLWFLHADTIIKEKDIQSLKRALKDAPQALFYFDLKFNGPPYMGLNALGANLRSRLFGWPYGDQALYLSKEQFFKLDGYDETVPYGEDLLLVRKAKKCGIKIKPVGHSILTSHRTYQKHGWLRTSMLYQWRLLRLLMAKVK